METMEQFVLSAYLHILLKVGTEVVENVSKTVMGGGFNTCRGYLLF